MKSDHTLWCFILLGTALLMGGCSDSQPPAENVATPAQTITVEPLTDAELLGVTREQIVLTLPWTDMPLARDPVPNAARATLQSVAVVAGGTFDRATFAFRDDAAFPGYRVAWHDSAAASCADSLSAAPAAGSLIIRFEPSTATEGGKATAGPTSLKPGLPIVSNAGRVCDKNDKLVWAVTATDTTRFRVVELRDPPRVVVDLQHPDTAGAGPAAPAGDSTATR